jgi:hypothetical protein
MLKVIEHEALNTYYMIHRMVLLATRTRGIPKNEPSGIHMTHGNLQARILTNDVDSYQEGSNVTQLLL